MNNYQIYEEIGKGRHSTVYKGRRKKSVDYFAIASIDKGQRPRVLNSVHFLRALSHPNIIKFHSWYETNNHLWVITEYCTSGDLRAILSGQKTFTEKSISVLAADIANGLMHMHSHGVMYCDLKPSNLLLDASAMIRFYDFGLAQTVETAVRGTAKVGTPSYMAPELFADDAVYSYASDLWSFGVVMWEMFAGAPPFTHTSLAGLMEAISSEPFRRLPGASTAFNDLLEGLLQKDPAQRMTWADVAASDFWANKLDPVPAFPKHAAFAEFLAARASKRETTSREGERAKKDILRASLNAERNLARELRAKGGYHLEPGAELGIKVDNEVDFREPPAEGDEDGAAAAAASSPASLPPHSAPGASSASSGVTSGAAQQQFGGDAADITTSTAAATAAASPHLPVAHITIEQPVPPSQQATRKGGLVGTGGGATGGSGQVGGGRSGPSGGIGADGSAIDRDTSLSVEGLLRHASDNHARPIVMNTRIERYAEPKFDTAELTFPARTVAQLKAMPAKELEAFLTSVYRSLAAASPVLDKFNTLCYFESLCADTQLANAIINSSIMSLCVKMLNSSPMPSNIRAQLATVMGLLLRYATIIHPELRKTNIIVVLMDTLDVEPQPRARRRMMACLGELLFYIATQPPQEHSAWAVDGPRVASVFLKAVQETDEVLRHIAVKAIENIATLSDRSFAQLFAAKEFVTHLVGIFHAPPQLIRNDYLRASALGAAVHLAEADTSHIAHLMSALGADSIGELLCNGSARVIQSVLTFLNLFLCKAVALLLNSDGNEHHIVRRVTWSSPTAAQKDTSSVFAVANINALTIQQSLSDLLRSRARFMDGLTGAMEHAAPAIRGKAALAVLLLTVAETTFLSPQAGDIKIFTHLEKLARDKDTYVLNCMRMLFQLLSFFVFVTITQLARTRPGVDIGVLGDDLVVTLHVLTSHSLRSSIFIPEELLVQLAECVARLPQFGESPRHQENLFLLLEALSQDRALLAAHHGVILRVVLPAAATLLSHPHGEVRFSALRTIFDFVQPIVNDSGLYDPSNVGCAAVPLLNDFIISLQPALFALLGDSEPIPLYTLKLLSACCERSTAILSRYGTAPLVTTLVEFASRRGESKNSIYALTLLLRVLQFGGEAHVVHACHQNLVGCIAHEITEAAAASQDQYLEACTETMFYVLSHAERLPHLISDCMPWLHLLSPVLLPLCADRQSYSECAASSVQKLVQLYPEARALLLDPSSFANLRQVLGDYDESAAQVIIPMLRALLIAVSGGDKEAVRGLQRDDMVLVQLQVLSQSAESRQLSQLAAEVLAAVYRSV